MGIVLCQFIDCLLEELIFRWFHLTEWPIAPANDKIWNLGCYTKRPWDFWSHGHRIVMVGLLSPNHITGNSFQRANSHIERIDFTNFFEQFAIHIRINIVGKIIPPFQWNVIEIRISAFPELIIRNRRLQHFPDNRISKLEKILLMKWWWRGEILLTGDHGLIPVDSLSMADEPTERTNTVSVQ